MSEASVTKALADGKRAAKSVIGALSSAEDGKAQVKSLGLYIRRVKEQADVLKEAQQRSNGTAYENAEARIAANWVSGLGTMWNRNLPFTEAQLTSLTTFTFFVREYSDKDNFAAVSAFQYSESFMSGRGWAGIDEMVSKEYLAAEFLVHMAIGKGIFDEKVQKAALDALESSFGKMLRVIEDAVDAAKRNLENLHKGLGATVIGGGGAD